MHSEYVKSGYTYYAVTIDFEKFALGSRVICNADSKPFIRRVTFRAYSLGSHSFIALTVTVR